MSILVFLFLIVLHYNLYYVQSSVLTAYDCTGHNMNITQLSLIHVQSCNNNFQEISPIPIFIQLIQKPEIRLVKIHQCKIRITHHVYYCGMHLHISAVTNRYASYIQEVGKQSCRSIISTGAYYLSQTNAITSLKINTSTITPKTFAGRINNDGSCVGESYSDYYGSCEFAKVV